MSHPSACASYDDWMARFRQRAIERQVEWLAECGPETYRPVFERGVAPEDELDTLADMSEWRGCGCGGGG